MRILILGAGKMGSFFTDTLSFDHECAVYEIDPRRMRFLYNTRRFTTLQEIRYYKTFWSWQSILNSSFIILNYYTLWSNAVFVLSV